MNAQPDKLAASCVGALLAGAATLAWAGHGLADAVILGVYAGLFLPWAALIYRMARGRSSAGVGQLDWRWLVAAAVLVRVVFLAAEPTLSDDIFRYVWDGRVAAHGFNPFEHAPAARALSGLRDTHIWPNINHRDVPTIYPPVAQMLFRVNAALGGATVVMRALMLAVEALGVAGVLWAVDRFGPALSSRRLKHAFCVYAFCPLVFVEVAWSGHVDVVAWTALVGSLLVVERARSAVGAGIGGALLGVSIATKFLGLLAIPLVVLGARRPAQQTWPGAIGRRLTYLAAAAAVVVAAYMPYIDAQEKLFAGFGTYSATWQANAGAFAVADTLSKASLRRWAGGRGDEDIETVDGKTIFRFPGYDQPFESLGWTRRWRGRSVPATSFTAAQISQVVAKMVAVFVVGLVMLWAIAVGRRLVGGVGLVLLALFFVAPVVHPWYVAWLVPLAAIERSRGSLVFSAVVLVAYLAWVSARAGGPWRVPVWATTLEFGVVAVAAIYEMIATRPGQTQVGGGPKIE